MPNSFFIRQVGFTKWARRYFIRQFAKVVLKQGINIRLPTGLNYYAPAWDPSATEVYVTKADMDWGSEKLLSEVLEKSGAFIDVGAHTGYYSLYMLPQVSWVYAFEPDQQAYDVLQTYQKKYNNLCCFRKAVSNQTGTMRAQVMGGGFTYLEQSIMAEGASQKNLQVEEIPVIRLDDYIETYKAPITGIKIDVDGPDLDVLEGAKEVISQWKPVVLIELDSGQYERLFGICSEIGYLAYAFHKTNDKPRESCFVAITGVPRPEQKVKMLFLVPAVRREFFDALCQG